MLRAEDVKIAVYAAGVNRADLLQREGRYPPPPGASEILGLEVAGVIEGLGDAVTGYKKGDRVCALLAGGGYAPSVTVSALQIMPIPHRLSYIEAAAIPEAFITAYANLFVEGELKQGERVLIHGGSSGVGTAAIQLAKVAGAFISCTVGNAIKATRCRELGADLAIDYTQSAFPEIAREWSPRGIDLILDIVGKEYFESNVALLAQRGRLVQIATMTGSRGELDLSLLMRKRAKIIGSVLRSRSEQEKGALVAEFSRRFLPLFESGEIKSIIDSVYPISQVDEAHARMRSSAHIGKIVLSLETCT